jgi:hypothetical protein
VTGTLSLQRAGRELAFANSRLRVARGEAVADADEFLYFALEAEVEVVGGLVVEAEDDGVVVLLPLLVRKRETALQSCPRCR